MEFIGFPKIPRLSRECIITEKIDGTNGQIYWDETCQFMLVGSRTRWITTDKDNYGFAKWASDHVEELRLLGPGHHFGEWWGSGIQRGYGLPKGEKRFSLFNASKWSDAAIRPKCCHVVPLITSGIFATEFVEYALEYLRKYGSLAAEGFMRPEGIVVFHTAKGYLFKKTLENDEVPKGKQEEA